MTVEEELLKVPGLSDAEKGELTKMLAQLDETLEKAHFHPIVKFALFNLQAPDGTWLPKMPPERLSALGEAIEETRKDKTIVKAMWDLLRLSTVLYKEMKAGDIALELYAVCDHYITFYKLTNTMSPDAEVGTAQRAAAKGAIGDTSKANAPKLGEKPPEGAVKINQLPGGKRRI